MMLFMTSLRRAAFVATVVSILSHDVAAAGIEPTMPLPTSVPEGTALVVADQNQELQTVMAASGAQQKLSARITYANFLGGPAILEAFRAKALDLAFVGNTPPIQAQAAGEPILIVAARASSEAGYHLAVRPGLTLATLEDLRGRRISYGEGTARQPFVLNALKAAGLTRKDVTLVPLRAADFPDAIRSGQVDVAVLNEPHFSRYLADYADRGASAIPAAELDRLPRQISYLYAHATALADPAKAAAIRDFVIQWASAIAWRRANPDAWGAAYYVNQQKLKGSDIRAIVDAEGEYNLPPLHSIIAIQQALVDVIYAAGDLRRRLDARDEFDLRFDAVLEAAAH